MWPLKQNLHWASIHLATVFAGLAVAFLTMKALYAANLFEASDRIAFEHEPFSKFWWFLREPLMNAINMFVLNDNRGATRTAYMTGAGVALLLLVSGLLVEWRRHGRQAGVFWFVLLAVLPVAAFSVNLIVAERSTNYRTIFTLTGVLLIFITLSWKNLCDLVRNKGRFIEWFGYAVALVIAIYLARIHTYDLIALLQSGELKILRNVTNHMVQPNRPIVIYFVQPDSSDSPAEVAYQDEFGSLSAQGDWPPKEMLKHLMRERFPNVTDHEQYYELRTGYRPLPKDGQFDVVIDMRKELRQTHLSGAKSERESDFFYLYRLTNHKQSAWSNVVFQGARSGGPTLNEVCAYMMIKIWRCPTIFFPYNGYTWALNNYETFYYYPICSSGYIDNNCRVPDD